MPVVKVLKEWVFRGFLKILPKKSRLLELKQIRVFLKKMTSFIQKVPFANMLEKRVFLKTC